MMMLWKITWSSMAFLESGHCLDDLWTSTKSDSWGKYSEAVIEINSDDESPAATIVLKFQGVNNTFDVMGGALFAAKLQLKDEKSVLLSQDLRVH
jgi:hypothetical protein